MYPEIFICAQIRPSTWRIYLRADKFIWAQINLFLCRRGTLLCQRGTLLVGGSCPISHLRFGRYDFIGSAFLRRDAMPRRDAAKRPVAAEAWRWQLGGGSVATAVVVAAPAAWRRRRRQLGGGAAAAAEWRLRQHGSGGSGGGGGSATA